MMQVNNKKNLSQRLNHALCNLHHNFTFTSFVIARKLCQAFQLHYPDDDASLTETTETRSERKERKYVQHMFGLKDHRQRI